MTLRIPDSSIGDKILKY